MITRTHYEVGQTALSIVCDDSYLGTVHEAVFEAREAIETKIAEDSFFGTTFDPYPVSEDDDPIIQRMCQASILAKVGPMAGVAGAVAEHAVRAAVRAGCGYIIVENGGDISMSSDRDVRIGLFAGEPGFEDLALLIRPTSGIAGVCSSSGKIGPSVSFGSSGICTVFSNNIVLADCCATALGNMIREGTQEEMASACESICGIEGIDGCLCVCGGRMAVCGDVPELVRGTFGEDKLTSIVL
ncbi:MAG: UPF0280 family protein [Candidatus Methanomethylophilaceae archaeon]|nr:UPF0280 family protein [Candidatus Methanomethylophilaceae archaeon]